MEFLRAHFRLVFLFNLFIARGTPHSSESKLSQQDYSKITEQVNDNN